MQRDVQTINQRAKSPSVQTEIYNKTQIQYIPIFQREIINSSQIIVEPSTQRIIKIL